MPTEFTRDFCNFFNIFRLLDIFSPALYNIYYMELLNPTNLWESYDRKAEPLNPSVFSVKTDDGHVTERLYFSGLVTEDGVVRVYARLEYPVGCDFKTVIVVMGNTDQPVDALAQTQRDCKAAVLIVDYVGKYDGERYTLYPKSLDYAQPNLVPDTFTRVPESPKQTCWYVWTVNLLRAVAYVETRFGKDARIVLIGVGSGGAQAVKAASIVDPTGTLVLGADVGVSSDTAFKAALSSVSYTPKIETPLLALCGSNEKDNAADRSTEYYNAGSDSMRLCIRPRSFGSISDVETDNIRYFIRETTEGKKLPECPELSIRASEGRLYCDVRATGCDGVELYAAQAIGLTNLRNWRKVPTESAGETRLARITVYDLQEPIYLLAVARYGALTLSSPIMTVNPAGMSILADSLTCSRLVYDSECGEDDWIADGGDKPARMTTGALGIVGITGDRELVTFKPGDRTYAAKPSNSLQVLIHSEVNQAVTFFAYDRNGVRYMCEKQVNPFAGWVKLTFSANEFKNKDGMLESWREAAGFGASADSRIVINSMLWV